MSILLHPITLDTTKLYKWIKIIHEQYPEQVLVVAVPRSSQCIITTLKVAVDYVDDVVLYAPNVDPTKGYHWDQVIGYE
jgi:hypothetical protein